MASRFIIIVHILLFVLVKSEEFSILLDDIFKSNETVYQSHSEVSKTGYMQVCWIGTINEIKYNNGSTSMKKELSIIFESSRNSSNDKSADKIDHKFSTQVSTDNFTIYVNKTIICGGGDVFTKRYTELGHKERLQIDINTLKMEKDVQKAKSFNSKQGNKHNLDFIKNVNGNHTQKQTQNHIQSLTQTEILEEQIVGMKLNLQNLNETRYKVVATIKLFQIMNGTDKGTILVDGNEMERFIDLEKGVKGVNTGNKSVLHAWNKLTRILGYKLLEEHYDPQNSKLFSD